MNVPQDEPFFRSLNCFVLCPFLNVFLLFFFLNQSNLNNRWCKWYPEAYAACHNLGKELLLFEVCVKPVLRIVLGKNKTERDMDMTETEIWLFCFTCLQISDEQRGVCSVYILMFTVHMTMMLFELPEFSITYSFMGNWQTTWTCTTNFIWMYKWIFIF